MRQRLTLLLVPVIAAGCSGAAPYVAEGLDPEPAAPADALDVRELERPLTLEAHNGVPAVHDLTLRERIGQLVMPWIGGEYWATDQDAMAAALRLVSEQRVGGFVVGLGGSAYDLAAKFNALQRASRLPLLIAADLESGPSMRIRGATPLPGNMALGASGREEDAYAVGEVIAREGRAVGIQMVFAPVVDVNNNPSNPIINTRSYGEDPARVGMLASAFIHGLRANGMLATAKHFPGHGDTDTDTHLALPVIAVSRSRLDSIELAPFRAAVAAGVDAVMTAHVSVPVLTGDAAVPATLSAVILDTLLRGELGFRGLVVTDALDMGAIVSRYGPGGAALRALQAGADILLMPSDPQAAIDAIHAAVLTGEVSEARLDSSVARILAAKAGTDLFRRRTVELGAIARVVGSRRHAELADSITRRSLVLVKDSFNLVPLATRHAVVVAYGDEGNTTIGVVFARTLRTGVPSVPLFRLYPASGPASFDSVRAAVRAGGGPLIFVSAPRPAAWRPDAVNLPDSVAALVGSLVAGGTPVLAVSFGSPYILGQIPRTPTFLAAWAATEFAERAAAEALLGRADVSGRLPVALPPIAVLGGGLMRAGRPVAPATGP